MIHHYFGEAVFDVEHILAITCVILAITFHLLMFLLNFWSVNANVFFGFTTLADNRIDQCTHVKIRVYNRK